MKKSIIFLGRKFFLATGGYYMARIWHKETKTYTPISAHRYVWEHYHGKIPPHIHIHHIDGNPSNNDISNLQAMTKADHIKLHFSDPVAIQKRREQLAKARACHGHVWHKSPEGRAAARRAGQRSAEVRWNWKPPRNKAMVA